MMNMRGVLYDMYCGFASQLRRNPWSMALLWFGLVIGTIALAIGFSVASNAMASLDQLPGDRHLLYYIYPFVKATNSNQVESNNQLHKVEFTSAMLTDMQKDGIISGYFVTINKRPIKVAGDVVEVILTIYEGYVPLLNGKTTHGLQQASNVAGLVVNAALQARGLNIGDTVGITPIDYRSVVGVVTSAAGSNDVLRLYMPMTAAPPSLKQNGFQRVGIYMHPGKSTADLQEYTQRLFDQQQPNVVINMTSGLHEHHSDYMEALVVAAVAVGGATAIAVLAFVNVVSLTMLWILNRVNSFWLRRAIGATRCLISLYISFDVVLLVSSAALIGSVLLSLGNIWLESATGINLPLAPRHYALAAGIMTLGMLTLSNIQNHFLTTRYPAGIGRTL